jgi:molecular chaperone GrpE
MGHWQYSCRLYQCLPFLTIKQKKIHKTYDMTDNNAEQINENLMNADESVAGTNHLNEEVGTENEIEKLQAALTEQKDKYLRLFAEFDNFKRRTAKERIELMTTAGKEVIADLLEVLDDADRAEKMMETATEVTPVKEGVQLVFGKLRNRLEQKGLKSMPSIGQTFNPDLHEAITEIPAPTPEMEGKVIDEVQKGYQMGEKIIRFAKVVVGK